jgi:DNA-binding ferritin-like protein
MDKKIIHFAFEVINQVKLYHWATKGYAVHKALDKLHGNLSDNFDKLVEVYLGSSGSVGKWSVSTSSDTNVKNIVPFLQKVLGSMEKLRNSLKKTEIQNIIDEMSADIEQTLYLLRLS